MRTTLAAVATVCCMTAGPAALPVHGNEVPTTPKEIGQRYGQALGVLEVCYGSKLTDKAKALPENFKDLDLEVFKVASANVLDAWVKVRGCTNQRDPNVCKIIMDKSCLAAEAEIGQNGSALPGLVEFLPHN